MPAGTVGRGYYDAFLMGLAANEVRLLPSGNAGVVAAVATGEADLGLTDTAKQTGLHVHDSCYEARPHSRGAVCLYCGQHREPKPSSP